MIRIVVHEKGGRTQRFDFTGDQFSVGREEDNDLVLDRVNISKYHLRFRRNSGTVEVLDLGSTNGTYINGRKVGDPRGVRRSDRVYVGDYILMLEGDDEAIAPLVRSEIVVTGADGKPQTRSVALPPDTRPAGEPLPAAVTHLVSSTDDSGLLTSARRVPPPGVASTYLDRIANRVLQTVVVNVSALDPFRSADMGEVERGEALTLIDGLVGDMQRTGEIEDGVAVEALKAKIALEAMEYGPLGELMKDPDVAELHVTGTGPVRVVHEGSHGVARAEMTDKRFSGDRALVLAIQRMARKWGFLVEGAQVLEGKVDDGFSMYALLPPAHVKAPVLNLRRNRTDANNLGSLVAEGVLSAGMRELLVGAIKGCRRILISASGATNLDRFIGAVIGEIPDDMRVACISDAGTMGSARAGWVQLRRISDPSDALGLSDAIGVVLRGGVDLLVSHRCRHEDAAAVMDAFAGATRGSIVSLWGIDSAHALWRLAGLSTVAAGAIAALTVSLARSVDLLVRLSVGVSGEAMQVIEIIEPRVKDGNEIVHTPIFKAVRTADGATEFKPTGTVPNFVRALTEQGLAVPLDIFKA